MRYAVGEEGAGEQAERRRGDGGAGRAVIATAPAVAADGHERYPETGVLAGRGAQIQAMLRPGSWTGATRYCLHRRPGRIVAPIYLRHLFRVGGVDDAYLVDLVDRVLAPPAQRPAGGVA